MAKKLAMPHIGGTMDQTQLENLARTGMDALAAGNAAKALPAFLAIADAGRATGRLWSMIADAAEQLGNHAVLDRALDMQLAEAPGDILALIRKGDAYARAGDDRAAVGWYQHALSRAAQMNQMDPALARRVETAQAAANAAASRFEAHLHAQVADAANDSPVPPRFAESLAILTGRQPVQLQQPTSFYYPGLPQIAFYDPARFDWAKRLEDAYDDVRAELEAVLADDQGIAPYVQADPSRPNRGHALLNDARWSAFHFFQNGVPIAENAARCPKTMALLNTMPMPHIAGRSPMALFSILQPKTHIPPHWGMLNTRLICHLPLIVPEKCRLRVGNHDRTVEAGKVLLFDDSIEHEAWNDSDALRVILLFEVWRPELEATERAMLKTLFEAVSLYPSSAA